MPRLYVDNQIYDLFRMDSRGNPLHGKYCVVYRNSGQRAGNWYTTESAARHEMQLLSSQANAPVVVSDLTQATTGGWRVGDRLVYRPSLAQGVYNATVCFEILQVTSEQYSYRFVSPNGEPENPDAPPFMTSRDSIDADNEWVRLDTVTGRPFEDTLAEFATGTAAFELREVVTEEPPFEPIVTVEADDWQPNTVMVGWTGGTRDNLLIGIDEARKLYLSLQRQFQEAGVDITPPQPEAPENPPPLGVAEAEDRAMNLTVRKIDGAWSLVNRDSGKSAPLDRESAVRIFDGLMEAFEEWGINRDHPLAPHVQRQQKRHREACRRAMSGRREIEL